MPSTAGARALHLTGITAALSPESRKAVEYAAERAAGEGMVVSLDVNYRSKLWSRDEARAVLAPLTRHVAILIASDDELGLVASRGDCAATADDAETALAAELLDRGVREVVVKRGAAGAGVHTADGRWESPAVAVTSIDTVGAGDAFTAGYLSALLDGEDVAGRLQPGDPRRSFRRQHRRRLGGTAPPGRTRAAWSHSERNHPALAAARPTATPARPHSDQLRKPGPVVKIIAAEVFVTSPSRNFVTLRITTEDGVTGIGDATLNGRELAVAAYLKEHVAQLLIGKDPHRIEDTWQFLYRSSYWRRGPVTMAAIAAVDMALWDIKGKVAGMPVYQLLGGASRNGLRAYGHASGADLPSLFDSVREHLELGYKSIRIQTAVPGIKAVYGVAAQAQASGERYDYEPAGRGAFPQEEDWDTRAYLRHLPSVFEAVRNEFGPELPLLHDGHHRMTPIQAAKLGKALEPYDLFWLEDCTPAENQEALRLVRQHTTTPLAIGEIFNTVFDYQTLIKEQLIDYVRAASTHFGGISPLKKVMDFAAQYQIKSGFHGPTDISPVGFAAQLHVGLAIHNYGIQEYMQHSDKTNEVFEQSMTFVDGYLHPGDKPGIGVEFNAEAAAAYPYQQAYLPYNRLVDGTVHDW